MKILYVHGTSAIDSFINALRRLGVDFEVYPKRLTEAFADAQNAEEAASYCRQRGITHLMSIHMIDTLVVAARKADIAYISLIWDAPYHKLFTDYGRTKNCWYSTFDRVDAEKFTERGISHVLYQPLAVDDEQILAWNSSMGLKPSRYEHEICFVGRLYDDNFYDEYCDHLPPVLQEYFVGIFENTAFRWDGINRINGTMSDELVDAIRRLTPGFEMVNLFDISDAEYFENGYLTRKIANIERICVLNLLAERYPVTLYTTSVTAGQRLRDVAIMPPICSLKELHHTFKASKINLNISLKGIEGGTPQRIMDIMGAYGFALTNYCSETADLFEEDREIVMFRTPEELAEKVDYYLSHDEERERIAAAGYEKVMKCYTCEKKTRQLLAWVGGENK